MSVCRNRDFYLESAYGRVIVACLPKTDNFAATKKVREVGVNAIDARFRSEGLDGRSFSQKHVCRFDKVQVRSGPLSSHARVCRHEGRDK